MDFLSLLSLTAFAICSQNLFAPLTDFPFATGTFGLCFRSLRSRYVRFAHFSVSVLSLTAFAICSLRSLFCGCVFAHFVRDGSLRSQNML